MEVFVYGDSISMQYGFLLKELLMKKGIRYNRLGDNNSHELANPKYNGFSTVEMLRWIEEFSIKNKDKIILVFNCGLHDIVREEESSECQVAIEEYVANLESIVKLGYEKFDGIIFCNTTPVDDERHNSNIQKRFRFNGDVIRYNCAAEAVMREIKVQVVDLYTITKKKQELGEIYIDHVHVKDYISRIHAELIMGQIIRSGYTDG